jgi:energy-converting hydrogenase A subunit M
MQANEIMPKSRSSASFSELYAAHERVEAAATEFVRLLLKADRSDLRALARVAEQAALRCMRDSLLLENEIKSRL